MNDLVWQRVTNDDQERAEKELTATRFKQQGTTLVARGHSVWAGPDKVSFTYSVKHCLKPKGESLNRAYIWQTVESCGFRRLPSGTILPYRSVREQAPSKRVPWRACMAQPALEMLLRDDDMADAFKAAARHHMGIREFEDLYPAAPQMGINKYGGMPWTLKSFYRALDPVEFTARAFGKTRVTKSLTDAIVKANPTITSIARQMRGIAEIEQIVKWINLNEQYVDDWIQTPDIRKVFLAINPRGVKYLTQVPMTDQDFNALGSVWFHSADNVKARIQYLDRKTVYKSFHDLAFS